ncbi:Type IIS restriction enzyme Eco57I [termite gut metagenome]|uniref:site-specific DNA-methyltransferase (adenine-specific) n=1 Tax=termite gut metagenome TaxID=433724 RepID=A0A5J4Q2H9_9ZZZZ
MKKKYLVYGFDIVIGNPPYDVYEGKRVDEIPIIKKLKIYDIGSSGKLNAYKLFIAKSITLLNYNGIFTQIFQNSFLGDNSAKLLRKHLLTTQQIIKIDSFPERDDSHKRVFKSAKMSVCILSSKNINKDEYSFNLNIWEERKMENSTNVYFKNKEILLLDKESCVIPSVSQIEKNILNNFLNCKRLSSKITCYQGEINLSTNKSIIVEYANSETLPLLKGAGVQKWFLPEKMSQGKVEYLLYKDYLIANKGDKSTHFKYPRIVMQGITGVDEMYRIKATIVGENVFCGHSINYISLKEVPIVSAYYYLALLNSEFSNWFFKKFSTNSNVHSYEIHNIPYLNFTDNFIQIIVSYLLKNKMILSDIVFTFFEQIINSIIYELYFSEKIHAAQKGVIEYLQDLKPIDDSMTDEQKLAIINSEFKRLYNLANIQLLLFGQHGLFQKNRARK